MNQQRDLIKELTGRADPNALPLALDTDRITEMVNDRLISAEKGSKMMKFKIKKALSVMIAAAALLALSVTVFAFSGMIGMVRGYSSSKPEYLSLPDAQTCLKDAGYVPTLLESFENGFVFQDGSLAHQELVGDGNAVVERYESFDFTYAMGGETVELVQEKYQSDTGTGVNSTRIELDGTDLWYSSSVYKTVPLDYEPTAEELEAQDAGTLSFGFSDISTSVEEHTVQTLYWQIDDMHYILYQMDGSLTVDDLTGMAEEILSTK